MDATVKKEFLPGEVRLGWLRFMYAGTMVAAGGTGLLALLAPEVLTRLLGWPFPEPLFSGAYFSCLFAFGILGALGLRSPTKFIPILLFQFCYKVTWLLFVIVPLWFRDQLPSYYLLLTVLFILTIIGDLIAVPFPYIFRKKTPDFCN